MSLPELKAQAKAHIPKIKRYYILPRAILIEILLKDKFPDDMILEKKTLKSLQEEAKLKNIPRIWSMRRAELLEVLYPTKTDLIATNDKKV